MLNTKDILKTSFCKYNVSLTGDSTLFFTISQELWSFKKLGFITKKDGTLMDLSFSRKWYDL